MNNEHDAQSEPQAQFRQALRLLHGQRPEAALPLLRALHEADAHDGEVALNLGAAYIMLGRYDEAQEVLERAAIRLPDNPNVWVNLAAARLGPLALSDAERQERAIQAYQQALAVSPEAPNVHYMLGLVYRERGDLLRAAAHFQRALEQQPDDRDAQRLLDELEPPPQRDADG